MVSEETEQTAADARQDEAIRSLKSVDRLQLVIAVAAILVSVASFYVAYLTSQSEAQQVKAATWPYLQFEHGNFDEPTATHRVSAVLLNSGVGPAMVKSFQISYQGTLYNSASDLMDACCSIPDADLGEGETYKIQYSTNIMAPRLIPAGGSITYLFARREWNDLRIYNALDRNRWDFEAQACYCSLLGDCYETDFKAEPREVKACVAVPTKMQIPDGEEPPSDAK